MLLIAMLVCMISFLAYNMTVFWTTYDHCKTWKGGKVDNLWFPFKEQPSHEDAKIITLFFGFCLIITLFIVIFMLFKSNKARMAASSGLGALSSGL